MPCYEAPRPEDDCREQRAAWQLRIDALTRIACDLAAVLRSGGTFADLKPVTAQWVEKHEEWDARRKARGGE